MIKKIDKTLKALRRNPKKTIFYLILALFVIIGIAWLRGYAGKKGEQAATPQEETNKDTTQKETTQSNKGRITITNSSGAKVQSIVDSPNSTQIMTNTLVINEDMKKYRPLASNIRDNTIEKFRKVYANHKNVRKILLRTESFNKDERYSILLELIEILQSTDVNVKYVGVYLKTPRIEDDIGIFAHPDMKNFIEDFKDALNSLFVDAKYYIELKEEEPKGIITFVLVGNPIFELNGSVKFRKDD